MLKIMMVINRGEGGLMGGAEKHLLDLCPRLVGRGYEIIMVSDHETLEKHLPHENRDHIIYEKVAPDRSWLITLARLIQKYQPSLIHAHKFKASVLARIAGKMQGKKVITTLHGSPALWQVPRWQKTRNMWINRLTADFLGDTVIAVAKEEEQALREQEKIRPGKITLLPNGLFAADHFPTSRPFGKEIITITTTAHLNQAKGHADIIEAAPAIIARFPRVRFLWLGAGKLQTPLVAALKEKNLQSAVALRTDVAPDEVPAILAASDMFLFPSHWEGLSYALLEAMAAALPIVATNVGGNATLIKHGKNGLLIAAKKPQSMTRAITYLLKNQRAARNLGLTARADVVSQFSGEVMLQKIDKLYQSLL